MERPYEKLIVWKEAYSLCLAMYRMTTGFPSYEKFGLTSQMRRAASSIPLNIAEGNAKRSIADKIRYIDIARGSLEELHCAVKLSGDLEYIEIQKVEQLNRRFHKVGFLLMRLRTVLAESF